MISCPECFCKHIALAKSFAREVINGHGSAESLPDHRIDLAGELANAELHAEAIDKVLALKVRHIRKALQPTGFAPDSSFFNDMDVLWAYGMSINAEIDDKAKLAYDAMPVAVENTKCCGQAARLTPSPTLIVFADAFDADGIGIGKLHGFGSIHVLPASEMYKCDMLASIVRAEPDGSKFVLWDSKFQLLRTMVAEALPVIIDPDPTPSILYLSTPLLATKEQLIRIMGVETSFGLFGDFHFWFPPLQPLEAAMLVTDAISNVTSATLYYRRKHSG